MFSRPKLKLFQKKIGTFSTLEKSRKMIKEAVFVREEKKFSFKKQPFSQRWDGAEYACGIRLSCYVFTHFRHVKNSIHYANKKN